MKKPYRIGEDRSARDLLSLLADMAPELTEPVSVRTLSGLIAERHDAPVDPRLLELAAMRLPCFARMRKGQFVTREALLQGSCLRVEPTAWELSTGLLIPGHRFLPLWWGAETDGIAACDADGEPIGSRTVDLSFAEAFPYHYLLGYNWIPPVARETAGAGKSPPACAFRVFDCTGFYAAHDVRAGDFLIVEIADAWRKRVVLRVERRADTLRAVGAIRTSDVALERALLSVLEEPYVLWSIPEQLFQALARMPAAARAAPGSTFERFLARTPSIALQEVGLELAAFPRDTSPFQLAVRRTLSERGAADVFADPLDRVLTRLSINMRATSVRGLLRLAAADGRTFTEAVGQIVPAERLRRGDREDVKEFRAHLKELWQRAHRAEADAPLGDDMAGLYRRAAALKERVLGVLRQLDLLGLRADELPSRPLLRMVEIDELAECILGLDAEADDPLDKAGELEELVADVEQHLVRLQDEIMSDVFVPST
jgi:hypothetical protein